MSPAAPADDQAEKPTSEKQPAEKRAAEKPARQGIAGPWLGTLDAGVKLRVVVNIEKSAEGKLRQPRSGGQGHRDRRD